mgnify:CR=1 FL=1
MAKEEPVEEPRRSIELTNRELVVTGATDTGSEETPFLQRLSKEERRHLIEHFPRKKCPPGSVLFREGELGQALYVIESGNVAILKEEKDATFTLLAYRGDRKSTRLNSSHYS